MMERLDQAYLSDLVGKTKRGDSNAFAELFAATWERQYVYLGSMAGDPRRTREALVEVYSLALQSLGYLSNPDLFLPWISRMSFRHLVTETEDAFSAVMNLPLTESQVLLMRYEQGFPEREIAELLNFDRGMIRRCLKSAGKHLQRGGATLPGEGIRDCRPFDGTRRNGSAFSQKPGAREVTGMLEDIYERSGWEPNTIPVEALSSYTVYRRERFSLQRGILTAAMVCFLLIPVLFITPEYEVTVEETGERGLPVYSIHVNSWLSVHRVLARLRTHALPVYEAGAKDYTVEPTRNGDLTIEVELLNRQSASGVYTVTAVDSRHPELVGSDTTKDQVRLLVEDEGIGVDYHTIYALSASGKIIHPVSVDAAAGEIVFDYPEENWDVYISDHIGNVLHLALQFA